MMIDYLGRGEHLSTFSIVRGAVQGVANRYGYKVERTYDLGEYRLDVLELLIDRLSPDRADFFFIEVGANDGIFADQIHHMIRKYRWRGILIEPQPDTFAQLVANYAGHDDHLLFENAAVAAQDGYADFWTVPGQSWLGSLDRAVLHRAGFSTAQVRRDRVRTVCVPTLLQKYEIKCIDLLQVDTEGFDFEVIKMFMAAGIQPAIINYEHLHLNDADRQECVNYLGRSGYKMLQAGTDGIDTVAYRRAPVVSG